MEVWLVVIWWGCISNRRSSMCKGTEAGSCSTQRGKCSISWEGGVQPSLVPSTSSPAYKGLATPSRKEAMSLVEHRPAVLETDKE